MTTKAGQALIDSLPPEWHPINREIVLDHIAAIEQEVRDDIRARVETMKDDIPHGRLRGIKVSLIDRVLAAISSSSATETQDGEHDEINWQRIANVPDHMRATPTPDDRDRGHRGWPTECAGERPYRDWLGNWLTDALDRCNARDNYGLPKRPADLGWMLADELIAANIAPTPDDRDREVERIDVERLAEAIWTVYPFPGSKPAHADIERIAEAYDAGLRASGGTEE